MSSQLDSSVHTDQTDSADTDDGNDNTTYIELQQSIFRALSSNSHHKWNLGSIGSILGREIPEWHSLHQAAKNLVLVDALDRLQAYAADCKQDILSSSDSPIENNVEHRDNPEVCDTDNAETVKSQDSPERPDLEAAIHNLAKLKEDLFTEIASIQSTLGSDKARLAKDEAGLRTKRRALERDRSIFLRYSERQREQYLKAEIKSLQNQLFSNRSDQRAEVYELEGELSEVREELDDVREKLEETSNLLEEAQGELDDLRESDAQQKELISDLEEQCAEKDERIEELERMAKRSEKLRLRAMKFLEAV